MRTTMMLGLMLAVVLAFGEAAFADTTWKDEKSGLTWQVRPTGETMKWSYATANHCSSFSLAGFTDWRLPTKKELASLIRGCKDDTCDQGKGPANGCYWPDEMKGECSFYWSSSPGPMTNTAVGVGFNIAEVVAAVGVARVRCVR